jgi:multiple sugar transport system substrate-binding protein
VSTELAGITWNHTRGFVPLVATSQRFEELHPEISITWRRRSLQAFADEHLSLLAEDYDFIILDHPWAGFLAVHDLVLPLDQHIDLRDQEANSVGLSHPSYAAGGHQWALAIDAAAPVSAWRPDLLAEHGATVPTTWEDLLTLADRGLVALPAIPIDSLMHLYMLSIALGEVPFTNVDCFVSEATGVAAIDMLRGLLSRCDPICLARNPIRTYEAMTTGDSIAYCPVAYGYVNYARSDYTARPLKFGGLVSFEGRSLRSTLGGTGLAITRRCTDVDAAMAYANFVTSASCQTGLYTVSGGQPGHRAAWLDRNVNSLTGNFFLDTLPTLDDAFLRPTYDGSIDFQDAASLVLHNCLSGDADPIACVSRMNEIYQESRADHHGA